MRISICDGVGEQVGFNAVAIKNEASLEGWTSLVIYEYDRKRVSISQYEADEQWDVSLNDETLYQYDAEDGDKAVEQFMEICRRGI